MILPIFVQIGRTKRYISLMRFGFSIVNLPVPVAEPHGQLRRDRQGLDFAYFGKVRPAVSRADLDAHEGDRYRSLKSSRRTEIKAANQGTIMMHRH